ncbi:hypothetical protein [Synergistes jonesii]|uniref:hypothetical protein n=1 Tax=Synergistes jonesii TaxID=2754 RepID=UPI00248E9544|nr:hypothetical protein [Synergistes jonesii]
MGRPLYSPSRIVEIFARARAVRRFGRKRRGERLCFGGRIAVDGVKLIKILYFVKER